ncbi:MAG: type II secretion system F family protein [Firmicutes bacterium]|nr:type II secretion system F family protein [Candidatus Fermentithermobacillaceae bacterium]
MRDLAMIAGALGTCAGLLSGLALHRRDSRLGSAPVRSAGPHHILARLLTSNFDRKRKQMAFLAQWPTLLESMAVAVSAGMDLLHAFEICVARTHGPLRESLEKVVVRLHSGMSLPAALAAMEKDGIDEARRLRATLAQAESLGTPVASVLEALAAEYYTLEKQRFESKLNSLPVKLSVITVIFLLPPVLIISVMPHVLSFIGAGW